jgi:phage/plasmid primase-like uncharacterized protein
MRDNIEQFRAAMAADGLTPPDHIEPGQRKRFPGRQKSGGNKAGWCLLFEDGRRGMYGDFSSDLKRNWRASNSAPYTSAEWKTQQANVRAANAQYEADKLAAQLQASKTAVGRWNAATPCIQHSYLTARRVPANALRVDTDGFLMVPMRDAAGKLWNIERINPANFKNKRGLPGGRRTGLYHSIGTPAGVLMVCEGYATGASIHEATGKAVAVAFSADNLQAVALALHAKYPLLQIIMAADDDYLTDGNPGLAKAKAAAQAVGGLVAVPLFPADRPHKATDFNDLYLLAGAGAVKACLDAAIESASAYQHGLVGLHADIAGGEQRLAPVEPEQVDAGSHALRDGPGQKMPEIFLAADHDSSASFSTTSTTNLPKPTNLLPKATKTRKSGPKPPSSNGEPNDPRPKIELKPGELDRIVNDMEQQLFTAGGYYNRGGLIASVVLDAMTPACIKPLPAPALMRALSRCINFVRIDGRSARPKSVDPSPKYVAALFEAESYPHLPLLRGIARQPHFREDGSLCMAAGYDTATGLFGAFNPADFSVKKAPTKQDAQHALAQIDALLTGFAFKDANAHAGALSAILTAAIRSTLPTAPMFHAAANQPGSGKSYAIKMIVCFAGPGNPAMLSMPPSEEELTKLLLATLLEAPCAVVFDNLTDDIQPFGSLCTALTESTIQGRVLGVSKNATVSTRTMVLSSGNNVVPVRDMARRVITIRLDPKTENPTLRQFTNSPLATLKLRRSEFVSYALTIIRAYQVARSPTCPRHL